MIHETPIDEPTVSKKTTTNPSVDIYTPLASTPAETPALTLKPTYTITPAPTATSPWNYIPSGSPGFYYINYDWRAYGFFSEEGPYIFIDSASYPIDDSKIGPGQAIIVSFANYKNLVAYWTQIDSGQLWISDVALMEPQMIFEDRAQKYQFEYNPFRNHEILIWTPNDRHLILDAVPEEQPDIIFHLDTQQLETWEYQCDRIAISPMSQEVALWCPAKEGDRYAVIEWEGEIWYSETSPNDTLSISPHPHKYPWAWSHDGSQVAYYDLSDAGGWLHLIYSDGANPRMVLPGSAYYLAETETLPESSILSWGYAGSNLLIFALGDPQNPCPAWETGTEVERVVYSKVPCWQVLDTQTLEVIWRISDSREDILSAGGIDFWEDVFPHTFEPIQLSPDGEKLYVSSVSSAQRRSYVISIENGKVLHDWEYSVFRMKASQAP